VLSPVWEKVNFTQKKKTEALVHCLVRIKALAVTPRCCALPGNVRKKTYRVHSASAEILGFCKESDAGG